MNNYVDWFQEKFKQSLGGRGDISCPKADQIALINLIEKYNIKSILEFGTYEGCTTALMKLHPKVERIKTLDHMQGHPTDVYASYLKKLKNILFVKTKINNWKPNKDEYYDLIFIDAGHSYLDAEHDTKLALRMKPKVIVWHDYPVNMGKDEFVNVGIVRYIEDLLSQGYDINFAGERIAWMELKWKK